VASSVDVSAHRVLEGKSRTSQEKTQAAILPAFDFSAHRCIVFECPTLLLMRKLMNPAKGTARH
jgi:hypothetical protein